MVKDRSGEEEDEVSVFLRESMIMDLTLTPSNSGKFIAENTTDIKINQERVEHVAKLILASQKEGSIAEIEYTANPLHPKTCDESALNWVLLIDTINFSFWPSEGEDYVVTYKGKQYRGYMAGCAALNKALEKGVPATTADWMQNVTTGEFDRLFKSDSGHSIPMLKERVQCVNETGRELNNRFGGSYMTLLKRGEQSAQTLLRVIVSVFEHFRDSARFHKQKIAFLKRAQILVADTYGLLKGRSDLADFKDMNTLTMFADYRLPQVLAYFGVLELSQELRKVLEEKTLMEPGDVYEVTLRGCSIHACDKIVEAMKELRKDGYDKTKWDNYQELCAADVDVWLWQYRQTQEREIDEYVPHHRCRTIYY